jgi:hypothetical protein
MFSMGGMYSTINDITAIGQSILHSELMPAALTRWWMKPDANTYNGARTMGAPWEIYRVAIPTNPTLDSITSLLSGNYTEQGGDTRIVDVYTKLGDLITYASALMLDPTHDFGATIMTTGPAASVVRSMLADVISQFWISVFEAAAKEASNTTFAGTYSSTGNDSSVLELGFDEGPGLVVKKFVSRGVEYANIIKQLNGIRNNQTTIDVRLYPMGLSQGNNVSYRAIIQTFDPASDKLPSNFIFTDPQQTWFTVDGIPLVYGNVGIEEFVFTLGDDGIATQVDARGLRLVLKKTG